MGAIRIRIGAALDPGITAVFQPLIAAAARARTKIAAEGKAGADEYVGGYRSAPSAARKAYDGVAAEAGKSASKRIAEADRAAKAEARAYEHVYQIRQRYLKAEEAAAAKSMKAQSDMAKSVISGAARSFGGAVMGGARLAGSIARGAGVNFDVGAHAKSAVDNEKAAVKISNSGYMPGQAGANGQRQDPKKLIAEAQAIGDATATSHEKALEGLDKYVSKTGDLETGRAVMRELAVLSKATGTDLGDMADAAADAANTLGETENKGAKVANVMRAIAGQGKMGAVEIKSLASQMAKVATAAGAYEGDKAENIKKMGALAQLARGGGGASSAAEAVTAVTRFSEGFASPARQKKFKEAGFDTKRGGDIFNEKGQTRDPFAIMDKALTLTKGDPVKMATLFASSVGRKAVNNQAQAYRDAGGGEAGLKAAQKSRGEIMSSAMGGEEISESFARAMDTMESKTQVFNNSLDRIASDTLPKLVPAFEKLAPLAVQLADSLAGVVVWASGNPFSAVGVAAAASMTQAIAAAGIEAAIKGQLGSMFQGGGMVLASATIGVAVGTIVAAKMTAAENKGGEEQSGRTDVNEKILRKAEDTVAGGGKLSPEMIEDLKAARGRIEKQVEQGKGNTSTFDAINPFSKKTFADRGEENYARGHMGTLVNQEKGIDALLAAVEKLGTEINKPTGVQEVVVKNMPPAGMGGAVTGPQPVR